MIHALSTIFDICMILALVALNAFFVIAEFALVKIRPSQLKIHEGGKGLALKCAIYMSEHVDEALSTSQLGVTVASLALGWAAEPLVAGYVVSALGLFGISDPLIVHTLAGTAVFAAITYFHIVLGEQAPKMLAIRYAKAMTLFVSVPMVCIHKIFFPAIWLLNVSSNGVLKLFGIDAEAENNRRISFRELEYMLSNTREREAENALVNRVMVRALRLKETRVNDVMLPRDEMNVLWLEKSNEENNNVLKSTGHSRYPVFRGNLDVPVGVLLVREWLWQQNILGEDTPMEPILRDMKKLRPDETIAEALETMRHSQSHLALVVNDEGRTLGLVCFEDLLEEIVGDIRDEFDNDKKEIFKQTSDSIVVAGTLSMHELESETGWNIDWDGNTFETVAEWVKSLTPGRLPKRGKALRVKDIEIIPLETPAGSLKRIKIIKRFEE